MTASEASAVFRTRRWPVVFGWLALAVSTLVIIVAPAVSLGLVLIGIVTVLIASDANDVGRKRVLIALTAALAVYMILAAVGVGLWLSM